MEVALTDFIRMMDFKLGIWNGPGTAGSFYPINTLFTHDNLEDVDYVRLRSTIKANTTNMVTMCNGAYSFRGIYGFDYPNVEQGGLPSTTYSDGGNFCAQSHSIAPAWYATVPDTGGCRGIDAYLVDGPGQGESRLRWGHYLTRGWMATWRQIVDHVVTRTRTLPLFIVGNSMGGCLVMNYGPTDERIAGICSNGGPRRAPSLAGDLPSKLKKFHVFCGDVPSETAEEIWGSLNSAQAMASSRQPLLILHGGFDPLVTETEVSEILHMAGSDDRTLVIFSDGDHCVYNHPDDKHNLVGDWILERAAHRH